MQISFLFRPKIIVFGLLLLIAGVGGVSLAEPPGPTLDVVRTVNEKGETEIYGVRKVKHGKYSVFDKNNRLHYECWYCNGQKFGPAKKWDDKGFLILENEYLDDLLHGRQVTHSDEGKQIAVEEHYVMGRRHGSYREWFVGPGYGGHLRAIGQYENGKMSGEWTMYFHTPDAKLTKLVGGHVDGERDGLWVMWRQDGTKMNECPYKKGKPHGDFIEYDEKEKEIRRTKYVDGVKQD